MLSPKPNEPEVNGGLILALSILGLLLCGPLALVSWLMSNQASRTLDGYPGLSQRGLVQASKIISVIGIFLWLLIASVRLGTKWGPTQRSSWSGSAYR